MGVGGRWGVRWVLVEGGGLGGLVESGGGGLGGCWWKVGVR